MFNTYSLNKQVSRIKLQIFNPQMPSLYRSYVLFISPYLFRIMPLPKIALSALMVPVLTLTTPQILPSASLREMSLASTVGGCGSAGTGGESKAAILARYRFNAIKVGEF